MIPLREAIELKRMHRLNMELLEQLAITCDYLVTNHVEVPNARTFCSLINKAMTLLNEITADEPKMLHYTTNRQKVTEYEKSTGDDFSHGKKFQSSDKDFTEPVAETYRGVYRYWRKNRPKA